MESYHPTHARYRPVPYLISAEAVANHAGPNADARAKVIFSSLIRHLHAFAREVQLTNEEWLAACDQLIEAG
jgi:catechol 1,2-dioxygenase